MEINISSSGQSFEVGGQQLFVDEKFAKLLSEANLTNSDLEAFAQKICSSLEKRGWPSLKHPIVFVVDQIPKGAIEFLFVYQPATIETNAHEKLGNSMGIISVFSDVFGREISTIKRVALSAESDQTNQLNEMLRGSVGLSICHEMCHLFGINTTNDIFKGMQLEDLELLTDCAAYESCSELIGEKSAYLGAHYVQKALRKSDLPINPSSVKQFVAMVLAKPIDSADVDPI